MAQLVLSSLATSLLAPSIYSTIAAGASIASSGFLWSVSQGLAGFAGSMVGSAIDRALFGSGEQNLAGPRLNDLTVQSSADGAALPKVYGTMRLAGNVIWSTGLEETVHTEEVGGGSNLGGGGSITTYTYKTDVAVAICEGEITGIRRIWADTKLIYDVSDSAGIAALAVSEGRAAALRIYTGTESQDPDPLIQAAEGAANTPAHRGVAYIVVEDLQLADFGNRLPNFQFEVVQAGTAAWHVQTAIDWDNTISSNVFPSSASYVDDEGLHFSAIISSTADDSVLHVFFLPPGQSVPVITNSYAISPATGASTSRFGQHPTFSGLGKTGITDEPGCFSTDWLESPYGAISRAWYWVGFVNGQYDKRRLGITDIWNTYEPNYRAKSWASKHGATFAWLSTAPYIVIAESESRRMSINASAHIGYTPDNIAVSENYVHVMRIGSSPYVFGRYDHQGNFIDVQTVTGAVSGVTVGSVTDEAVVFQGGGVNKAVLRYDYDSNSVSNLYTSTLGDAKPMISAGGLLAFVIKANANYTYHNWDIEPALHTLAVGTVYLDDVAADILDSSGLSVAQYDVAALAADVVRGYSVSRPMAPRSAMEPLMAAYAFDLIEEDGVLIAVKRGGAVAATLNADSLGAAESPDGTLVGVVRNNVSELPSEISITYPDIGTEYQPATQYARRLTARHANKVSLSFSLVMTSQEAARLAEILLNLAWWSGGETYSTVATFDHLRLSPSDRVGLPVYGNVLTARITEITAGSPGLMQLQAVPDVAALYSGTAVGADAVDLSQTIAPAGPTRALLLDCVMLRDLDDEAGLYVAMSGYSSGWPGGALYKSNDGGSTYGAFSIVSSGSAATMGYATTVLATHGCTTWDRTNTVTVRLTHGSLSSATELAVLNGANAGLLGAHGRWELIQWQTATDNGDGTWTLSNLLRGRRGTDHAAASHAVGDHFVVLSASTIQSIDLANSEIGTTRHYKSVTSGKALESVGAETMVYAGERLECLSPVDVRASRDGSGNITLTWKRRNRINAGWNNFADVPMSEATQSYEVDIYTTSGFTTVKRTLSGLSSATASYTAAQQTTDFGSTQSTIHVRVYQLSATVGRGHYRQASV